jgi:hypothetical protein
MNGPVRTFVVASLAVWLLWFSPNINSKMCVRT